MFNESEHPRVKEGSTAGQFTDASNAIKAAASDEKDLTEKEMAEKMDKYNPNGEQKLAVKDYTQTDYVSINNELRHGSKAFALPEGVDEVIGGNQVELIDNFLANAPKVKAVSYRGLSFNNSSSYESFKNSIQHGSIISDKAFMSTSFNKDLAFGKLGGKNFGAHITIAGKNGVYLGGFSSLNEKEILFPRNGKYKITSIMEEGKFLKIKLIEE